MPLSLGPNQSLCYAYDGECMVIEPWGENSLRVRACKQAEMPTQDWALLPRGGEAKVSLGENGVITHGKLTATVSPSGRVRFTNAKGKVLLEEFWRTRGDATREFTSSLLVDGREFKPIPGGDYQLTLRFESEPAEKIFGMGQYQQPNLDLKGCTLELAHRNSQASVPFLISSLGYGFLWNNPAIGQVVFGKNVTTWQSFSTKALDYWITAGDTPAEIEERYASVTGTVPMMPDFGTGLWQSKLRYRTQEEVLAVAREYQRRKLPISVIVVDYFHWTCQGDWKFDPEYWPDPEAMVAELEEMGIQVMVSIWPYVDHQSENFNEMLANGYLIRTERGVRITFDIRGNTVAFDPTNPEARAYVWNLMRKNYYDKGIRIFWLDEAEPEYTVYDFDNYRYHQGTNLQIGNIYPVEYARTFYEGMQAAGQEHIVNLLRCAWAGSQRYGALVWSGDVHSSFQGLREQLAAGLNMAIAGIPWWTTDTGGFFGGNPEDEAFREVMVRWFQWSVFCPVLRMHGKREPLTPPVSNKGGGLCPTGAANELWSFGEEVYDILRRFLQIREGLRPYIQTLMAEAHEKGTPLMRPLFYVFPEDSACWEVEDAYLFGPDILVAPITGAGQRQRAVYLPAGRTWTNAWTGATHQGGQHITVDAPLEQIPLFTRDGFPLTLA